MSKKKKYNRAVPAPAPVAKEPMRDAAEEFAKIQAAFAKALAEVVIHDPSGDTSRRKSAVYNGTATDKASVEDWLLAPTSNEKNLRNSSIYLYQTSSRYRELVTYYSSLPLYSYVITSVNFNPEKVKPESFRKQYKKVCDIMESMNVASTVREAILVAIREGAYYGVVWGKDGNSFILQKLDADNCVITSMGNGVFNFAYNMSKVKEADLATHYPPEFTDMYRQYQADGRQYQPVPQDIAFCIKADPTVVEYSIPPFAAVLPTLYTIKTIEELAVTAEKLENYKLLSAKMPVDDNGVPILTYESAMQYYAHIAKNLPEMIGLCISPFDIEDHKFEQSGSATQIDTVSRATKNFFEAAGTSANLHGYTSNATAVTKLRIKPDESFAFNLMHQCERVINKLLRNISGTQKFKIRFLDISVYNREEMLNKYKEALNYGICKLEYMACLGIPQHDILNKAYIEREILDIDNQLTILKTSATQTADDGGEAGRPLESDEEIDDAGERTRDDESNENR